MTEFNLFQNSEMLLPVVVIVVGVWMVFIWKEWRKPLSGFFYWNSLIALLTITSIAMLALKPQTVSVSNEVGVLLTNGFKQKQLDSLRQLKKGLKVYAYQENFSMEEVLDSLSGIYILGDGVKPFDFWQFENKSVTYLDAETPEGIIRLKYRRENRIGKDLVLKGRYHMSKSKNRLVIQDGNGRGIDSIIFKGNEFEDFELKFPLKTTGKFVFRLIEKDSLGKFISDNPIPFKVSVRTDLRILIINGFPSFETKYLKNYLSEMGHEVVVRSQLTKGKYKFEYFNTSKKPIYRLDESILKRFDLMIIDVNSFRSLSGSTKTAIQESIKQEGLGLFLQPDANISRLSKKELGFRLQPNGIDNVVLDDFSAQTWKKLSYDFENVLGIEKIHTAGKQIVTAYKRSEKGRIGTTLIQNTYQLQLDGKKEIYKEFWSTIVERLAKNQASQAVWNFDTPFPIQNEPLRFELHTKVENPEVFMLDAGRIALQQDGNVSTHWSGVIYPKINGWNKLHQNNDSLQVASFFVTDSNSWAALRQYNLQKKNKPFFRSKSQMKKPSRSYQLISPILFFIIGLTGLGYLWLYPKVFQN